MSVVTYVNWDGGRIKSTWRPGGELPPQHLVTSVHGFCFDGDRVLMVDLRHRGWDIPGGHVEPGETPEETFRREAMEEGSVRGGACTYLGCVEIDHHENPKWQPGGRYPLVGYQVMYRMDVAEVLPFNDQDQSARRLFAAASEVRGLHHSWNGMLEAAFTAALSESGR